MTDAFEPFCIMKRTALAATCAIAGTLLITAQASAQTPQPPTSALRPTHSVEMIAPAATVTSTVHYQAMVPLVCGSGGCTATFNRIRRNQQLNIARVWCDVVSSPSWLYADLYLRNRRGNILLQEGLPLSASNPDAGFYQVNRAVDLQVAAGQTMQVSIAFTSTPQFGACTAAGTLSTLQ